MAKAKLTFILILFVTNLFGQSASNLLSPGLYIFYNAYRPSYSGIYRLRADSTFTVLTLKGSNDLTKLDKVQVTGYGIGRWWNNPSSDTSSLHLEYLIPPDFRAASTSMKYNGSSKGSGDSIYIEYRFLKKDGEIALFPEQQNKLVVLTKKDKRTPNGYLYIGPSFGQSTGLLAIAKRDYPNTLTVQKTNYYNKERYTVENYLLNPQNNWHQFVFVGQTDDEVPLYLTDSLKLDLPFSKIKAGRMLYTLLAIEPMNNIDFLPSLMNAEKKRLNNQTALLHYVQQELNRQ